MGRKPGNEGGSPSDNRVRDSAAPARERIIVQLTNYPRFP
jgi:hypothetical protein